MLDICWGAVLLTATARLLPCRTTNFLVPSRLGQVASLASVLRLLRRCSHQRTRHRKLHLGCPLRWLAVYPLLCPWSENRDTPPMPQLVRALGHSACGARTGE